MICQLNWKTTKGHMNLLSLYNISSTHSHLLSWSYSELFIVNWEVWACSTQSVSVQRSLYCCRLELCWGRPVYFLFFCKSDFVPVQMTHFWFPKNPRSLQSEMTLRKWHHEQDSKSHWLTEQILGPSARTSKRKWRWGACGNNGWDVKLAQCVQPGRGGGASPGVRDTELPRHPSASHPPDSNVRVLPQHWNWTATAWSPEAAARVPHCGTPVSEASARLWRRNWTCSSGSDVLVRSCPISRHPHWAPHTLTVILLPKRERFSFSC